MENEEDVNMEEEQPELEPEPEPDSNLQPQAAGGGEGETTETETQAEGQKIKKRDLPPPIFWQVRVCPIQFEDFCNLKSDFQAIIKLCAFCEFRMSQHLWSKLETGVWARSLEDKDLPWLPNEKTYTKPQNAATAGMLELKVVDDHLVPVTRLIRSLEMTKRARLRFEMKRLVPKHNRKEATKENPEDQEQGEEPQTGGDNEMMEEPKTAEEIVEEVKKSSTELPCDMTVNIGLRLKPVRMPAFNFEPGYVLKPEDKQIFLSKVSDDIPDNVLNAIMLSEMSSREKSPDGNGMAVFNTFSPLGAHGYMELFDGILVDNKVIEMATTLGTLYDARKKHSEKQEENREANEKEIRGMKRKPDGAPDDNQKEVKKPREDPINPIARMWLRAKEVYQGAGRNMPGFRRPTRPSARGTRGAGRPLTLGGGGEREAGRGGRGRGMSRGRMSRGGGALRGMERGGKVFVRGGQGRARGMMGGRGSGEGGRGGPFSSHRQPGGGYGSRPDYYQKNYDSERW
ncbi:hypothetical protein ACOMHN_000516 [Nucella lapillus]